MNCPKFGFEINDSLRRSYCRNCEGCDLVKVKPRFELGEVDVFELARKLKEREVGMRGEREKQQIAEESRPVEDQIGAGGPSAIPLKLWKCPICGHRSLARNKPGGYYECLNRDCRAIGRTLSTIFSWRPVVSGVGGVRDEAQDCQVVGQPGTVGQERLAGQTLGRAWWGNEYYDTERRKWRKPAGFPLWAAKLGLNLLILVGLGLLVVFGYKVLAQQGNSLWGAVLALSTTAWVMLVRLSRSWRFRFSGPSFRLTATAAVLVLVVLSLVGVQPMSSYKDTIVASVSSYLERVQPPAVDSPSTSSPDIVPGVDSKPTINVGGLEAQIHDLVNKERRGSGISKLVYDSDLARIARVHSEDMADRGYFDHSSLEGLGPTERAERAGYDCYKDCGSYYYYGVGENIFQGWLYSSITYINGVPTYHWLSQGELASSTVDGWMDSVGHRQNILNAEYSNEGIGVAIADDGKVYITQDFW